MNENQTMREVLFSLGMSEDKVEAYMAAVEAAEPQERVTYLNPSYPQKGHS